MVDCEYHSQNRLEPSLQTTNNGLDRGNSTIMSMIEEHDEVEEGLDGYTMASREFVAGETLGL